MSPILEPGQWYLTVVCSGCETRFPLFRVMSEGQLRVAGIYNAICPHCEHESDYTTGQVERYQHPVGINLRLVS